MYTSGIVGLQPSEVWDMTLSDFQYYVYGYNERKRMEQENLVLLAHQTGTFTGLAFNGKLKPLDKYLPKETPIVQGDYSLEKAREQLARIDEAMINPVYLDLDNLL